MPRRLTQQRMTLSDLELPFQASRAISAVSKLLVPLDSIFWFNYTLRLNVQREGLSEATNTFEMFIIFVGRLFREPVALR